MSLVSLLILAISISPRIALHTLESGRSIDLRYEDILLVLIMFLWLLRQMLTRKGIYLSPIFKPLFIYISIAIVSSSLGIIIWGIDATTTFFFISKEIQYMAILIVVINHITQYNQLGKIINVVLICGLISTIYVSYQFVSGLFVGSVHGYYGVASIGEPSSFASGGYFAILTICSFCVFLYSNTKLLKCISAIVAISSCIALVFSGSRANVVGTVFAILILLPVIIVLVDSRKTIFYKFCISVLAVGITLSLYCSVSSEKAIIQSRVANISHMRESFIEDRVKVIYPVVWNGFEKSPIIGQGKTACSLVIGGTGEAHNHYLRILVEMGIIGLLSFLYVLLSIIKISLKVYKNSRSYLGRAIGLACLLTTANLMVAALVQDAFIPVKVNEMFWILVGLTAVENRLNIKDRTLAAKHVQSKPALRSFSFN